MRLIPVADEPLASGILWDLLSERTPGESISHGGMPDFAEHLHYVRFSTHREWLLIENDA